MRTLLLSIACATLATAQAPELSVQETEFSLSDGRRIEAELGSFRVPTRRGAEDTQPLTLRFVRFKSTNPKPGHPVVYLAGGPGGAGTGAARGRRYEMFEALRAIGDVIAFDQRGTGLSDQLPRPPSQWSVSRTKPVTREKLEQAIEGYATICAKYWREQGVDLAGFNTKESADDLEDLRLALGAKKLHLVGISYGTHLAQAMLRRHPESVARVVLAGCEGLDQTVKPPSQQQALLQEIARRVQLDEKAREQFPDFLGDLRKVLERAREEPLDGKVTEFDLQRMIAATLRGPERFKDLPLRIQQLAAGDTTQIQRTFPRFRIGNIGAMSAAMDAASGLSAERSERIEREAPKCLLGDAINFPYGPVRAGLGVPDLGDEFRAALESSVPALFISGTLDGRTPPENAEEVRRGFETSAHWILDGAGHSDPLFLSSPEIIPGIRGFLAGEELEDRTIELPPIRFTLPEDSR